MVNAFVVNVYDNGNEYNKVKLFGENKMTVTEKRTLDILKEIVETFKRIETKKLAPENAQREARAQTNSSLNDDGGVPSK